MCPFAKTRACKVWLFCIYPAETLSTKQTDISYSLIKCMDNVRQSRLIITLSDALR